MVYLGTRSPSYSFTELVTPCIPQACTKKGSPPPRISGWQNKIHRKIGHSSNAAPNPLPRHAFANPPPNIATCAPTARLAYASECKHFLTLFCVVWMCQHDVPDSSVSFCPGKCTLNCCTKSSILMVWDTWRSARPRPPPIRARTANFGGPLFCACNPTPKSSQSAAHTSFPGPLLARVRTAPGFCLIRRWGREMGRV